MSETISRTLSKRMRPPAGDRYVPATCISWRQKSLAKKTNDAWQSHGTVMRQPDSIAKRLIPVSRLSHRSLRKSHLSWKIRWARNVAQGARDFVGLSECSLFISFRLIVHYRL